MNRIELQQLAEERIIDGQTLLAAARWSGAYYIVGYAVECGLKACILKRGEQTGVIFDDVKSKFLQRCLTHNLEELLGLADLSLQHGLLCQVTPVFAKNWDATIQWSETARYHPRNQAEAEQLMHAVTSRDGVLPWIRSM